MLSVYIGDLDGADPCAAGPSDLCGSWGRGLSAPASVGSPIWNPESFINRVLLLKYVFYSRFSSVFPWTGLSVIQGSELTFLNDYQVQGMRHPGLNTD